MVLLQLCLWKVFTQRYFVSEFIRFIMIFIHKNDKLLFEPPFEGLTGNERASSRPIARWKALGRLPIRNNWTFFASSHGWHVISRYWSKSALFTGDGSLWAQILGWSGRLPNHCWYQKTRVFLRSQWRPHDPIFVRLYRVPACVGRTDGRTKLP